MIATAAPDIAYVRDAPFAKQSRTRAEPEFDGVNGIDGLMITEQAAREPGFDVVTFGGIVRTDDP